MKKRRFYPLGYHSNIKNGFGTVDTTNIKSVYMSFSGWVNMKEDGEDVGTSLSKLKKEIKKHIYNINSPFIRKESIVDIDISLRSLTNVSKKTYMETEVTLFISEQISLKDEKMFFTNLSMELIDNHICKITPFNFYKTKI